MIEFKDVGKVYHKNNKTTEALKHINLRVEAGEICGIIGYSGAGKSTLIRMINALERPTSGSVIVEGTALETCNAQQLRVVKRKIGMIFQGFNLLESKTVFDNVALPLVLQKIDKAIIKKKVLEMLEFVGLADKARSYPKELSGGQKQRVGIARALVINPSILLCDEATSALDPQTTLSILDLLKRINDKYKITIVIITHEMAVIQHICDKVAVIQGGEIVENGDVFDIFSSPKQQITKQFVSSVINDTLPRGIIEKLQSIHFNDLYRLEFLGNSATQPVVNDLIVKQLVSVNILFAQMSEIKKTVLGSMFVQFEGSAANINEAVDFLTQRGVRIQQIIIDTDQIKKSVLDDVLE